MAAAFETPQLGEYPVIPLVQAGQVVIAALLRRDPGIDAGDAELPGKEQRLVARVGADGH